MKKKLAIFTPLPPTRSGISDYSIEIGSELSKLIDVIYVIDDMAPTPIGLDENVTILRYSSWILTDQSKYVCFHQMGNNLAHRFSWRELLSNPGFVLLHDISLHHLFLEISYENDILYRLYFNHIAKEMGTTGSSLLSNIHRGLYIPELFKFIIRANNQIIDNSLGVVVHSESAYNEIKKSYPKKKLLHLPFPYKEVENINNSKEADGLIKKNFIISSFGFVTPSKQIEFILEALSRSRDKLPNFKYLIVGEVHDQIYESIFRKIRSLNLEDVVTITGFTDLKQFHNYIEMSDLIVTLRYPSAGESSAVLLRSLGQGKANVVFDYESFSGFPDNVVYKIPLDTFNTCYLEKAIIKFANNKRFKRKYEIEAKKHIVNNHNIKDVAQKLISFLRV